MSTYGQIYLNCEYTIDLCTRRIVFRSNIGENYEYTSDLLSEMPEPDQPIFAEMLKNDNIELGILDTDTEYCNVVISGLEDAWEEN